MLIAYMLLRFSYTFRLLMTSEDFISKLFCRVDDAMRAVPKHA